MKKGVADVSAVCTMNNQRPNPPRKKIKPTDLILFAVAHLSALYDTLGQHKQLSSSDVVLIFPLCSASFQQYPQAENAGI